MLSFGCGEISVQLRERELCALLVARPRRRQLALVKIELVRRHCTEVRRRQCFKVRSHLLQTRCGTLTGNGPRTAAARACEGEVWHEGRCVAFKSQRTHGVRYFVRERLQVFIAGYADPENAWGFGTWEETCAAKRQGHRRQF